MNSWKLNGMAGHVTRTAICKGLNIPYKDIYKTVKSIDINGTIILHDGRKFSLELKYLENDNSNKR